MRRHALRLSRPTRVVVYKFNLQRRGKIMTSQRVLADICMLFILATLAACGGGGGGGGGAPAGATQPGQPGQPGQLAQTGQLTSYVAGDDGAVKAGVAWPSPRFTVNNCATPADNTDDVVTDQLTGLMWVRDHGGNTSRTWQQSLDYANALSLCGFTDWRLANVSELDSLDNADRFGFYWLAEQGFLITQGSFWSSTTNVLHANRAWNVSLYGNNVAYDKTTTAAAWAVRGPVTAGVVTLARTGQATCYNATGGVLPSCTATGQDGEFTAGTAWPSPRFGVNDCGTPADTTDDVITDNLTGLMWPRQGNLFATQNWTDAVSSANGLSLCGHTDWRLPNRLELRSLVNYGEALAGNWLVTQGFENVQAANVLPCYWTSTSASADVDATHIYAACGYLFDGALESLITKTEAHHVWPVR
jgi:hypothetical protein